MRSNARPIWRRADASQASGLGCPECSHNLKQIVHREDFMEYTCSVCGKVHDDLPHIGDDRPAHWWDVPDAERSRCTLLTPDICVIDDTNFFIRGVIDIPVYEYPKGFGFGAWISLKHENFVTYINNFNSAD